MTTFSLHATKMNLLRSCLVNAKQQPMSFIQSYSKLLISEKNKPVQSTRKTMLPNLIKNRICSQVFYRLLKTASAVINHYQRNLIVFKKKVINRSRKMMMTTLSEMIFLRLVIKRVMNFRPWVNTVRGQVKWGEERRKSNKIYLMKCMQLKKRKMKVAIKKITKAKNGGSILQKEKMKKVSMILMTMKI